MPIVLSTLFTTPQDVWDMLSVEGVDLREDDHNASTGQAIEVSADTAAGALAVSVLPIPVALLSGAVLTFDGPGVSTPLAVTLTAAAAVGAISLTVAATGGALGSGASARDSGLNAATGARLVVATRKGTSKVKLYCNSRYDDSVLRLSGTVLDWATVVAAKFLCTRRAQACPKSIAADYEEAIEEMRQVHAGQLDIEDVGTRGSDWPTITNVIVNPGLDGMRVRVLQNVSEGSPPNYGRYVDWNSAAYL